MAHELAVALQQAGRIWQRCALKEPYVYVRREYIDVAEGRISKTCNRTTVVEQLADLVPALSHHLKPPAGDGSQFNCILIQPVIDSGVSADCAVESQQCRSHHRLLLACRGFGLLLRMRLSATAARMRSFKADTLTLSPSWMSMARLMFPSRLELNRPEGSSSSAPLAKVILTTFLYVSPVQTMPSW